MAGDLGVIRQVPRLMWARHWYCAFYQVQAEWLKQLKRDDPGRVAEACGGVGGCHVWQTFFGACQHRPERYFYYYAEHYSGSCRVQG